MRLNNLPEAETRHEPRVLSWKLVLSIPVLPFPHKNSSSLGNMQTENSRQMWSEIIK